MSDLRQAAQQALDALNLVSDEGESKFPATIQGAISDLEAALAQQAEAVAAERERCAEYLMQQAAECRENSPTRVTLESCAAVLRLGLHAQAEAVEPVAWFYQNMYTEQEYLVWKKGTGGRNWRPLYTAPPQRKPLTEEEIDALPWNGSPRQFARAIERAHGIGEGA